MKIGGESLKNEIHNEYNMEYTMSKLFIYVNWSRKIIKNSSHFYWYMTFLLIVHILFYIYITII